LKSFHDFLYGGAWPFLVRELICLVNSVNVRDLNILIRQLLIVYYLMFLRKPAFGLRSKLLNGDNVTLHNISTGKFEAITGLECP
jgi:hypothetical protein